VIESPLAENSERATLPHAAPRSHSPRPFTYHGAKTIPVRNSNELLDRFPPCVGMKTGFTREAGYCLVAAAEAGEKVALAVLFGSTEEAIWTDAERLLRYSLAR